MDCSTGQFYLCEFSDDSNYSTFRTLLAHNQTTQILQPRNGLSKNTQAIINSILGPVPRENLQPKQEFLTAYETLRMLMDDDYLGPNVSEWPKALNTLVDLNEVIPKAKTGCELVLNALGGIFWYLRRCLIDVDLVTMRKFDTYTPATILQNPKVLYEIVSWFRCSCLESDAWRSMDGSSNGSRWIRVEISPFVAT